VLVERHSGDWLHGLAQSNILFALRRKYPHLKVVPELRSRITETRYRLPDICALLAAPQTRYLVDAAYLIVEILSERDVMSAVIEKLKEYAAKGVPNIWVVDPRLRLLYVYRPATLIEVDGDSITSSDGAVELSRSEIFAE